MNHDYGRRVIDTLLRYSVVLIWFAITILAGSHKEKEKTMGSTDVYTVA